MELEYSFFQSFSCFSSSSTFLSPSQNSQLFTSLEFCNLVNDDVLHCWTEKGRGFPVWLWSLSVLVIAPAAAGENETLQPQVLCYTSHLLDPVLYSLVSTTLQTKPGFFWHSFSCSLYRNSTGTLRILLFSSHLCISFTGLPITISLLLWIWWTVKLRSFLLEKNRFGFFSFQLQSVTI